MAGACTALLRVAGARCSLSPRESRVERVEANKKSELRLVSPSSNLTKSPSCLWTLPQHSIWATRTCFHYSQHTHSTTSKQQAPRSEVPLSALSPTSFPLLQLSPPEFHSPPTTSSDTSTHSFRMHSRPTPEHRVPVSYSPLSSSHPNKSPRRRVNSPLSTPQGGLQVAAHDAATWLGGRVGHSSLRRWMVLAGLSFAGVVLLSSSSSTAAELSTYGYPSSGRWSLWRSKQEDDTGVPPRVDRSTLEKLRLLEIHFGADEDDPTEGDPDGVSYSGRRTGRDPDAPPLVAEIPEPVKVSATAPPPLEKIPADVLDERTCGARDGQGCQFLVPAWLGAFSPFLLSLFPLIPFSLTRRARNEGSAAPVPTWSPRPRPQPHPRPAERIQVPPRMLLQEPLRLLLLVLLPCRPRHPHHLPRRLCRVDSAA